MSAGSRRPADHLSSECPAWRHSGASRLVGWWDGAPCPLGYPVAVGPRGSPSLQATASTPERGASTVVKMFTSPYTLFAEADLASASRGVSELPPCIRGVTPERSLVSPGRRGGGGRIYIPNLGGKGHTNTRSEERRNSTDSPHTLSA